MAAFHLSEVSPVWLLQSDFSYGICTSSLAWCYNLFLQQYTLQPIQKVLSVHLYKIKLRLNYSLLIRLLNGWQTESINIRKGIYGVFTTITFLQIKIYCQPNCSRKNYWLL